MKKSVFYCYILLTLCSCATNKPITSTLNPAEIRKVGILQPIVSLKIYAANSEQEIQSEEPSYEIRENVDEAIKSTFIEYKVNFESISLNPIESGIINKEVESFFNKMEDAGSARFKKFSENFNYPKSREAFAAIKVSQEVVEILNKHNMKFALATLTVGFTRSKKNENNRVLANAGKLLLTAALFTTGIFAYHQGIPYRSNTYFFLIDAERKNLSMYNKKVAEIDPTNESSMKGQINWGLEDYWVRYAIKVNPK